MPEPSSTLREACLPQFRAALDFAAGQCRHLVAAHPDYYPMYTVGGRWHCEGELWTHWCEGFLPGILWLLHKHTGEPEWRALAERYTRPLEPRQHDRTVHDLGFLFFSTYLRWYHLTGDPALRAVLIEAGRTLALRRQKGGYLASFVGPESLFIDIMMNVGLTLWAADATGDEALLQVGLEHCRTTQRYLVRPDGGTAHEAIFDLNTGQCLRQTTHQGYRPESTWSRGLAWAIYGFTAVHRLSRCVKKGADPLNAKGSDPFLTQRLSGAAEFLATARRCADYYLQHAPPGLVPLWDFDAPADGRQPWDSSAAAITASGLWDLAEQVDDAVSRDRYRTAALTILQTLCGDTFLARGRPAWEGILMHGVYHYPRGLGVDESVAWGEHFFVEALVKVVAGRSEAGW